MLNSKRLHSSLDYLTLNEAYLKGVDSKCYNAKDVLCEIQNNLIIYFS